MEDESPDPLFRPRNTANAASLALPSSHPTGGDLLLELSPSSSVGDTPLLIQGLATPESRDDPFDLEDAVDDLPSPLRPSFFGNSPSPSNRASIALPNLPRIASKSSHGHSDYLSSVDSDDPNLRPPWLFGSSDERSSRTSSFHAASSITDPRSSLHSDWADSHISLYESRNTSTPPPPDSSLPYTMGTPVQRKPDRQSINLMDVHAELDQYAFSGVGLGITTQGDVAVSPVPSESRAFIQDEEARMPRYGPRSRSASVVRQEDRLQALSPPNSAKPLPVIVDSDAEDDLESIRTDWDASWTQKLSAAVRVAEEGTGNIVDATGVLNVESVVVGSETTHLLLNGIQQPLHIHSLLADKLPSMSDCLLVLDISSCSLAAIPAAITCCASLEELNISQNPLLPGFLPAFLADLVSLRVLLADNCNLHSLNIALASLPNLHTLSLRFNLFKSLPQWLARLSGTLEVLLIDGNPFHPRWAALLSPLMASTMSPQPAKQRPDRSPSRSPQFQPYHTSLAVPPHSPRSSLLRAASKAHKRFSNTSSQNSAQHGHASPEAGTTPVQSNWMKRFKSAGDLSRLAIDDGEGEENIPIVASPAPISAHPSCSSFSGMSGYDTSVSGLSTTFERTESGDDLPGLLMPSRRPSLLSSGVPSPLAESSPSSSRPTTPARWGFLKKFKSRSRKASQTQASIEADLKNLPLEMPRFLADASRSASDPVTASSSRRIRTSKIKAHHLSQPPKSYRSRLGSNNMLESFSNATSPSSTAPPSRSISPTHRFSPPLSVNRRRSFLPILEFPPSPVNSSPRSGSHAFNSPDYSISDIATPAIKAALQPVMAYLRDLDDLLPIGSPTPSDTPPRTHTLSFASPSPERARSSAEVGTPISQKEPLMDSTSSGVSSIIGSYGQSSIETTYSTAPTSANSSCPPSPPSKLKENPSKRQKVIAEIVSSEESYVSSLVDLLEIYVDPASAPARPSTSNSAANANQNNETVIPATERKAVFGNLSAIVNFHRTVLLPELRAALKPPPISKEDPAAATRIQARHMADIFLRNAALFRFYHSYMGNFDTALQRVAAWSVKPAAQRNTVVQPSPSATSVLAGATLSAAAGVEVMGALPAMTVAQRKRVRHFLRDCRAHPKHTQLNLESYLLMPVQRIPRYRMLLESLLECTPAASPESEHGMQPDHLILKATDTIRGLASELNERKRENEGRQRLFAWQKRIRSSSYKSPLCQPHRTLIKEGVMTLSRVVRTEATYIDSRSPISSPRESEYEDDAVQHTLNVSSLAQIHTLRIEAVPRSIVALLCNDILVLLEADSSDESVLNLYTVVRFGQEERHMHPASIFGHDMLRLVDSRGILYLTLSSIADIESWRNAINTQSERAHATA